MSSRSQRLGPRGPRPDPEPAPDAWDVPPESPAVDPDRPRGRGDDRASEFGRAGARQQFHNAQDVLAEIDNMQDSGKFRWASDGLTGIAETIERTMYVTAGQRRAINNIRRSAGWDPLPEG
jgi:hypothetical protein